MFKVNVSSMHRGCKPRWTGVANPDGQVHIYALVSYRVFLKNIV